jgi:glyoxylase-like metal-dependent hydrolase (beta-lactamase superfamily II)
MDVPFNLNPPETARLEEVAPGIRRLVAGNAGPFTFTGTCTYLVGTDELAIIDPGPEDGAHFARLLAAIGEARVGAILVTHTHRDHSPLARFLAERTGARILGCGPHAPARPLRLGEANPLDASADLEYRPDSESADGARIAVGGQVFTAIATPGHTANHISFALDGRGIVFSGDHVMGWSTSIVAPPDGSMADYLASLEKLAGREEDALYLPGHGGGVADPRRFTRAILSHRKQREMQIMDRLANGPRRVVELVEENYPGLRPELKGAAGLSTFAHLEDLFARGLLTAEPELAMDAVFRRR